jgi:hypothetical protein
VGKSIKKIAGIAAPVVGNFLLPGFGGVLGGALGGALGGGGLKGVGLGALGGGAFGYAPALAGASGLQGAALSGLTRGIQGAGLGGISGGGRGALLGAGLGGLGGYIGAGGNIPGLGSVGRLGAGGMAPTPGTGLLGNLSKLTNATAAGGSQPMSLGSLLSKGGDVLGYLQSEDDLEGLQGMLARQSQLAQNQFSPYAQAGQTALANLQAPSLEALQNDPGYQFRLQQGNQALDRRLAAMGMSGSGAALKAAQEFGQGLADQTYNDYYNRQMGLVNQGFGAASGLGSLYTNLGNTQAAAELERINQRNNLYSSLGGLFG